MKKNSFFLLAASMVFVGGFFVSRAQEQAGQKTIVVATTNIYDAKIVSQEGNNFKISFVLSNRVGAQPDVKYSVALTQKIAKGEILIEERVYDEVVSLAENETIKKEIAYQAPSYLKGKYNISLSANNSSSLSLAFSPSMEVSLNGTGQYIQINNQTCYLKVENDASNLKYNISQGVDIAQNENLLIFCEVKNNYSKKISIAPKFTTYYRSIYGEKVLTENPGYEEISIAANGKANISYKIPKPSKPQAYDGILEFQGNGGGISNKLVFHYVLQGAGATIQNLTLDKDYYAEGEKAKAQLFWSGSADGFPGSRASASGQNQQVFVEMNVSSNGKECVKAYGAELLEKVTDISLSMTTDCANPLILVKLKDSQGNILDSKELKIESKNILISSKKPSIENVPAGPNENVRDGKNVIIVSVFTLVLIILIILLVFVIKKRKNDLSGLRIIALLSFFASALIFGNIKDAKAETVTSGDWTITATLDKQQYNSKDTVIVTGKIEWAGCRNHDPEPYMDAIIEANKVRVIYGNIDEMVEKYGEFECMVGSYNGDDGIYYCGSGFFPLIEQYHKNSAEISINNMTGGRHDVLIDGVAHVEKSKHSASYSFPVSYNVVASCDLPWGGTISHGESVVAYSSDKVACNAVCDSVKETRTCNNGVLSGSFTNQSCSAATSCDCVLPSSLGVGTLTNGSSVKAYSSSSVSCENSCDSPANSETRVCNNGILSGSFMQKNCDVGACASCNFNGTTVLSGKSIEAYTSSTGTCSVPCAKKTLNCYNGAFTPSGFGYYLTCTSDCPTRNTGNYIEVR